VPGALGAGVFVAGVVTGAGPPAAGCVVVVTRRATVAGFGLGATVVVVVVSATGAGVGGDGVAAARGALAPSAPTIPRNDAVLSPATTTRLAAAGWRRRRRGPPSLVRMSVPPKARAAGPCRARMHASAKRGPWCSGGG
jgi:hypothetical protein